MRGAPDDGFVVVGEIADTLIGTDELGRFRRHLIARGLAERTVRVYCGHLQRLLTGFGGAEDLFVADGASLARFASDTPNTASNRRQLRSTLRYWYAMHGREDPPLRAVRVPPKPAGRFRGLEVDDARQLVAAARGWQPQGLAVMLGLYAALRREEIARARWDRFDHDLEWYTVHGKGDRVDTVPVHSTLRAELEVARASTAYVWLFPGSRGRAHVTPATVWGWVHDVAEVAGLGRIQSHQLRHTAIASVHDGTGDLRAASMFARHRRLETTKVYTRTTAAKLRAAVEAIDY